MDFTPTARTITRLIAEKPTDADMEIAHRVAHWIADVAQCLPGDFSTEGDPEGEAAIERLRQSANALTGQTYLVEALQTLLQTPCSTGLRLWTLSAAPNARRTNG